MIFFDIDGTLLDHKRSELLGVKEFYEIYKENFKIGREEFYKIWCEISDKYFNIYLKGKITFKEQRINRIKDIFSYSNIKLTDEEAEEKFKIYLSNYENNWKPFDDVIPCLKELSRSYKLGIISNGDLNQQLLKLERMKIKKYFSNIIISGELGISKPDIKIFISACKKVNEKPQQCYYIGDNFNTDIISCENAGFKGIWLNRTQEVLVENKVKVINKLEDLVINL
ncbi:HAD family hydrolase [Clostridium felsineum]|uniref:Pyrimidine 5'-nucleotidase YjjG n=1 Tax=Clostridium felsineum TaxID=36839 RepID=A0A1S8LVK9_9CLOT|nr:HAD family hydrolase [Clostridium felsineum]URZ05077.1 Pyrimidine 5'-nucleotidase YjjG [Clostridium felsineum]URZ10118.1 Pyrimidine 5'-nucleotidase YjjG [Clostridium felsineum]